MMSVPMSSTADRFTVRAAVAPLLAEARIASPLTSQLVAGDVVHLVDGRGDWLRVRGADDYEGWTHVGYLMPCRGTEGSWRVSLGCVVRESTGAHRALPFGARVLPAVDVLAGEVIEATARGLRFPREAQAMVDTTLRYFSGTSYQWGGVTPWGVDCSGLVQRSFGMHGCALPRDAWQQAAATDPVHEDASAEHPAGDLLFFSDREDRRVTHVGIALGDGRMVHSALLRGGVAVDHLAADEPYMARLRAQCTGVHRVRR
jgi:hypothetical protein